MSGVRDAPFCESYRGRWKSAWDVLLPFIIGAGFFSNDFFHLPLSSPIRLTDLDGVPSFPLTFAVNTRIPPSQSNG